MTDFQKLSAHAAKEAERSFGNKEAQGLAAVAYALLHLADVITKERERSGGDV